MLGRQHLLCMRTIWCAIDNTDAMNHHNDVHIMLMWSHFQLLDRYHHYDNATTTVQTTATRTTHGDKGEGVGVVAGDRGGWSTQWKTSWT